MTRDSASMPKLDDKRMKSVISFICERVKQHPKITKIVLFGSRALGDHSERSDFDIAFYATSLSHAEWADISLDIRENAPTLCGFDLVLVTDTISDEFRTQIVQQGITIYEKPSS